MTNKIIDDKYTIYVTGSGSKFWYVNNKLHREDSPAIEYGSGHVEYYINNEELKPRQAIHFPDLQRYPKLIESMIIYLVHNS